MTYNYFKPKTPVEACKVCGCKLSRVRFISESRLTEFLDGKMPTWLWSLIPSRCRQCGDPGRTEWKDKGPSIT